MLLDLILSGGLTAAGLFFASAGLVQPVQPLSLIT
jgi:hypothetical protein